MVLVNVICKSAPRKVELGAHGAMDPKLVVMGPDVTGPTPAVEQIIAPIPHALRNFSLVFRGGLTLNVALEMLVPSDLISRVLDKVDAILPFASDGAR